MAYREGHAFGLYGFEDVDSILVGTTWMKVEPGTLCIDLVEDEGNETWFYSFVPENNVGAIVIPESSAAAFHVMGSSVNVS